MILGRLSTSGLSTIFRSLPEHGIPVQKRDVMDSSTIVAFIIGLSLFVLFTAVILAALKFPRLHNRDRRPSALFIVLGFLPILPYLLLWLFPHMSGQFSQNSPNAGASREEHPNEATSQQADPESPHHLEGPPLDSAPQAPVVGDEAV